MGNYETITIREVSDELLEELKEYSGVIGNVYTINEKNWQVVDVHKKKAENTAPINESVTLSEKGIATNIFKPETISYNGQKYRVLLELHLTSDFEK